MSLFFDIGAHIGNWALSNIHLCDKIISVEASPITFKKLVQNCKHDNIILLNYAVCNNDNKDICFYHADSSTISTLNEDWLKNKNSRFYNYTNYNKIICKSITIDKLIEQYGEPDLIKIDVESAEDQCLSSLTKQVKLICFEWASEFINIAFNCIDYLDKLGYTQFYIQLNSDAYTFRPQNNDFYDILTIKENLLKTKPKKDFGMIWCKP